MAVRGKEPVWRRDNGKDNDTTLVEWCVVSWSVEEHNTDPNAQSTPDELAYDLLDHERHTNLLFGGHARWAPTTMGLPVTLPQRSPLPTFRGRSDSGPARKEPLVSPDSPDCRGIQMMLDA
eukprot:CAMPEP_0182575008 /NCGR_PEP_ID=MMETSP1324-20130603/28326_1 /TAXON_ID=236786 /ORGANISM="Florenciella sp., Strain RCC1587" /LENGTH=120 /DNA_ID=CAMNT_0024790509 /DNA_START=102 /DNA_END=465 /DNA_ORIENTATION=-